MKIILFNGPPGSGKDHATNYLHKYLLTNSDLIPYKYKFAGPLKKATHAIFGLDVDENAYEHCKDIFNVDFFGNTPRAAYIVTSEEMIKPVLGGEHWGNVCVNTLIRKIPTDNSVVIISDCGFIEEIQPLKRYLKPENMIIVQLHREGFDYTSDSRDYIDDEDIMIQEIDNTSVEEFEKQLRVLADVFLGVPQID